MEMAGVTLKLLGHPTPFGEQELMTDNSNKTAHNLTRDLNRFFLILFPFS